MTNEKHLKITQVTCQYRPYNAHKLTSIWELYYTLHRARVTTVQIQLV